MNNRADEYSVLFHTRARGIFFSLCHDFTCAVAALDRQDDENVFQKIQANYLVELRKRLKEVALEIVTQLATNQSRDQFYHNLASVIDEYINEFVQKVRAL